MARLRDAQGRLLPEPPEGRFREKVDKTRGCWWWIGALSEEGYGYFNLAGESITAHRAAYTLFVGPVPDGLTLDHECHNQDDTCPGGKDCFHRSCVRPDHLVLETSGDNAVKGPHHHANKSHCKRGHPFDEANTRWYTNPQGQRMRFCRACEKWRKGRA